MYRINSSQSTVKKLLKSTLKRESIKLVSGLKLVHFAGKLFFSFFSCRPNLRIAIYMFNYTVHG